MFLWIWGWEAQHPLCAEAGTFHYLLPPLSLAPSPTLSWPCVPWLGPYLCYPGSLQQFPEHPRCPRLPALGPLHTAADAREALFLSHSQPQRVDDFSPLLEPGSEPLRISPAHMAASGITAPLSRPVLAPMSPAPAAGPSLPPVPRNLSFLCITLYSPSSLYHFPPPLPSLNLPMTPIVLLCVPLAA